MRIVQEEFTLSTKKKLELVDITSRVEDFVRRSGVRNGICLVYLPHATAALITNEHEKGLMEDILRKISEEFPHGAGWKHDLIDDNASAHLASSFIGSSRVFPISGGRLVRGTWQNIFLVELDGPRSVRRVLLTAMGD